MEKQIMLCMFILMFELQGLEYSVYKLQLIFGIISLLYLCMNVFVLLFCIYINKNKYIKCYISFLYCLADLVIVATVPLAFEADICTNY